MKEKTFYIFMVTAWALIALFAFTGVLIPSPFASAAGYVLVAILYAEKVLEEGGE